MEDLKVHPQDWKNLQPTHNLNSPIPFPLEFRTNMNHVRYYSYWNYQQAWFNTSLMKNSKFSHSWLIFFSKDFQKTTYSFFKMPKIPFWFKQWWSFFGATPDILHSTPLVIEAFTYFKETCDLSKIDNRLSPMLHFCFNFFIPWVFFWNYSYKPFAAGDLILTREFKVKWWNKCIAFNSSNKTAVKNWLSHQKVLNKEESSYCYPRNRLPKQTGYHKPI